MKTKPKLWLLLFLSLVSILFPLGIGNYLIEREVAGYEAQRIQLRELSEKETILQFLYEESTRSDLSYSSFRELRSVIPCESAFRIHAISPTNDYGILQINAYSWDAKARELGLHYKEDWRDNIRMGVWIYKEAGGIRNWVCSLLQN